MNKHMTAAARKIILWKAESSNRTSVLPAMYRTHFTWVKGSVKQQHVPFRAVWRYLKLLKERSASKVMAFWSSFHVQIRKHLVSRSTALLLMWWIKVWRYDKLLLLTMSKQWIAAENIARCHVECTGESVNRGVRSSVHHGKSPAV